MMANLQIRGPDYSVTRQKAVDDARKMQSIVVEQCSKKGQEPPPYMLSELIGKGSFGRVYKATDIKKKALVAVKIIDIEESDTLNPKLADTYREILNEINALKLLSESGAKNVNVVIDAMPVGQSMWIITEYCAGGSVSTLMKPTAPGGLQEKWIIPIIREVAEAIFWVHRQGIIHRDIKCANVLVTESGGVQLCDFGVAGIIENRTDKRTTFIGTPHWMAPELFDKQAQYGTEVDIWAFGSMVYEIASGLPPNVTAGIVDVMALGNYLKQHTPRLEGDRYSRELKDLVAYCLAEDPSSRPTIEEVQHHPYIFDTNQEFPTASLAMLVRGYKLWEAQGGSRKSLFAAGGAVGPSSSLSSSNMADLSSTALANDEWNFSTTADFEHQLLRNTDSPEQAVYDAYGTNVDFGEPSFGEEAATSRPNPKMKGRRRPPPQALAAMKVPLEKVFDPNTISNYEDNSRAYYGKPPPPPTATVSDLPLREASSGASNDVRESLIDLDDSLHGSDLAKFVDLDTIRAGTRASVDYMIDLDDEDATLTAMPGFMGNNISMTPDYNRAPLSDPADLDNNRRTKDWKFPPMLPPASANPEMSRFPFNEEPMIVQRLPPGPPSRPNLMHHPTEPIPPSYGNDLMVPRTNQTANRVSAGSLIDLDMSFPDPVPELTRPSTANSDVASVSGASDIGQANNPFDLERHTSLYIPSSNREPSIYVSDDSEFAARLPPKEDDSGGTSGDNNGLSAADGPSSRMGNGRGGYGTDASYSGTDYSDNEYTIPQPSTVQRRRMPPGGGPGSLSSQGSSLGGMTAVNNSISSVGGMSVASSSNGPVGAGGGAYGLPPMPAPPSERVLQGLASNEEIKNEFERLLSSFGTHLHFTGDHVAGLPVRRGRQDSGQSDGPQ